MPTFPSNPLGRAVQVALAVAVWAPSVRADTLPRARLTVDASNPAAVELRESFDWSAQGGSPRQEISFFLASSLKVTSAKSQNANLTLRSEAAPGAPMTKWTAKLASALSPGSTLPVDLVATVKGPSPGIEAGAQGGYLLPGSGWFPAIAAETDEMPAHVTDFKLPAGWVGVACGAQSAPGTPWTCTKPGRPYAAWGTYRVDKASDGGVDFVAYRKKAAAGAVPRTGNLAKVLASLTTGIGEAPGTGAWKLVDVGGEMIDGGQRTLFWDESQAAAAKDPIASVDRDLAGGLAAAYWNESMRFFGPQAALLSGGFARGIGDAAVVTLDASDDRWKTERRLFSERRALFLKNRPKDRPLKGLVRQAPDARTILDGRGAIVVHMAQEACPSPAFWISFLHDFRAAHDGERVEWADMARALDKTFTNQHGFLTPYLETTKLPDFVFGAHGPSKRGAQGDRYSVEIMNKGQVGGYAEIATFTPKDNPLRTTRYFLDPGQKTTVLFGDARLIAHVRLDPRGTALQSAVDGESFDVAGAAKDNMADFVPSFPFSAGDRVIHEIHGLDVKLDGITITGFDGAIQWWETYHGPSGAVLLGKGHVVIAPSGDFAASLKKATGKDRLEFDGEDFFVRFPLATWKQISGKVGDPVGSKVIGDLSARRTFWFEHSFPTYFADKDLAEVPPPGGALAVFGLAGGESRGFVRQPLPSGKVLMRLWDHLRGTVIWEATL